MNKQKIQKEIKKLYKEYTVPDEELKGKILEVYQRYASFNNLKLNPNPKILSSLLEGLLRNLKVHGECYCPCRRVTGNIEEDKDKICPCKWHKEEIERDGHCHCGLFVKKENDEKQNS